MRPISLDGSLGDTEDQGHLGDRQPTEEPQFDHPRLTRIERRQPIEALVQGEEILGVEFSTSERCEAVSQGHLLSIASPFGPSLAPRVVDEQMTHDLRTDGEEVGPALPVHL